MIILHSILAILVGVTICTSRALVHPRYQTARAISGSLDPLHPDLTPFTSIVSNPGTPVKRYNTTLSIPFPGIPFPKEDWQGLRKPNYTILYLNYTEPIHCMCLWKPIGVYGFAHWLVSIFALSQDMLHSIKDNTRPSYTSMIRIIANNAYFLFSLARSAKAFQTCELGVKEAGGPYTLQDDEVVRDPAAYTPSFLGYGLLIDILSCASELLYFFIGIWIAETSWASIVIFGIRMLILIAVLFFSLGFYIGYTNFLYIDSSLGGPIAVVTLLIVFIVAGISIYVRIVFHLDLSDQFDFLCSVFPFQVLEVGYVFHMFCVGFSYILLGRCVDDPWGRTSTSGPMGVIQASLDGFVPFITVVSSVLGGSGG